MRRHPIEEAAEQMHAHSPAECDYLSLLLCLFLLFTLLFVFLNSIQFNSKGFAGMENMFTFSKAQKIRYKNKEKKKYNNTIHNAIELYTYSEK